MPPINYQTDFVSGGCLRKEWTGMIHMLHDINDCYTLSNGVKIPCVGYGTYVESDAEKNVEVIGQAIRAGYRLLDTASFYGTETYMAQALKKCGIPREEFFITSKVWKTEMGYEQTKEAFDRTLENLQTDYLDMYLIHWPVPGADCEDWRQLDADTWRAMEELYEEGRIRAIGVSNFLPHHIENLLENGRIAPMVDQLEFHPGYHQAVTLHYCKEHNIRVQAWSPLGRRRVLEDPLILELARKYETSAAQICLRFAFQEEVIPLPKASSLERMEQNQDIFSFEISREDMYRLETMPQTGWSGQHPDGLL